jgi:hypothetical protein
MKSNKLNISSNWILYAFLLVAFVGGVFINYGRSGKEGFSNNYLGPYLSAAAYYKPGQLFLIDTAEVNRFRNIDEIQSELAFRFKEKGTYYYNHNPVGYIYFIQAGKLLFGRFFGDAQSVVWLQLLAHLILCTLLWKRLSHSAQKWLFGIFYLINPLVLYFVTFNFYYFWQVLPCFGVLFLWMDKKPSWESIILLLLSPIILATRPTLFFVLVLFFGLLGYYSRWYWGLLAATGCFLLFSWIYAPNKKNPWHTAYIGLGAYPNRLSISVSDEAGYALYEKTTGERLEVSVGGNYYDNNVIDRYKEITKEATMNYAKTEPLAIIRNGLLNFLQSFSLGYFVNKPMILYLLVACSGLVLIILSLWRRHYLLLALIFTYVIAFVPYFPPIPAYLFGAYLPIFFLASLMGSDAIRSMLPKYKSD